MVLPHWLLVLEPHLVRRPMVLPPSGPGTLSVSALLLSLAVLHLPLSTATVLVAVVSPLDSSRVLTLWGLR